MVMGGIQDINRAIQGVYVISKRLMKKFPAMLVQHSTHIIKAEITIEKLAILKTIKKQFGVV